MNEFNENDHLRWFGMLICHPNDIPVDEDPRKYFLIEIKIGDDVSVKIPYNVFQNVVKSVEDHLNENSGKPKLKNLEVEQEIERIFKRK